MSWKKNLSGRKKPSSVVSTALGRVGTSLQAVENRLRLLYGLAGEIGADLTPRIELTALAGDLTGPGCNDYRGRRWAATLALTNAAVGQVAIQAVDDLIVEGIWVASATAALELSVILGSASIAYAPAVTPVGLWTERLTDSATPERPPVLGHPYAAISLAGTTTIAAFRLPSNSITNVLMQPIHLPRGARCIVAAPTTAPATFAQVNFAGRVF